MAYIEAFIEAVPTKEKDQFIEFCKQVTPVFKKHGAIEIVDCWGDDIPEGKHTSFPMAVKLKEDETVALSWIIWPDKATRDKGSKLAMEDPSLQNINTPFDLKRVVLGGFEKLDSK